MYMDKDLMEDNLYQKIDQFNKRKFAPVKLWSTLFNETRLFCDKMVENVRYCLLIMIK